MSFNISLYTNKSEHNSLVKELELIATATGTLKFQTSLIDPSVIIDDRTFTSVTLSDILSANYCVIPDFGRSYFIRNIESASAHLWVIHLHCDVLSSFRAEILENSAIVKCNEVDYNLYINDGQFKVYQNSKKIYKSFPEGFDPNTGTYVLLMAGGSDTVSGGGD